ncbi:MAG: hypothetical protein ACON35_03730 [Candidatus Marinamargulisbacteria bacterium]
MTRTKWAIILVGLISIGTFAQSTDKNRATLEKLSETLKSKNISSRVVTQNIKQTRSPKIKKKPTAKNTPIKRQLTPIPPTNNITPLIDNEQLSNEEIAELKKQTKQLTQKQYFIEKDQLKPPSGPFVKLYLDGNYLPLQKARINPSSTISTWLSLSLSFKYARVSFGTSSYKENKVGGSATAFAPSDTTSQFYQVEGRYPINETTILSIGYLLIETKGTLAYATLHDSLIEGINLGLHKKIMDDLTLSIQWFPSLNNRYSFKNIDSNTLPEAFQPDGGFTSKTSAVMFGASYQLFRL